MADCTMKQLMHFCWLAVLMMTMMEGEALAVEKVEEKIIHHINDPDPQRHLYIWNPFPGFCGPNATRVTCGGVCPNTCRFRSLHCPPYCGVPCKCKKGYVFDEISLKCIRRRDCPKHQGRQQVIGTHRVFQ